MQLYYTILNTINCLVANDGSGTSTAKHLHKKPAPPPPNTKEVMHTFWGYRKDLSDEKR